MPALAESETRSFESLGARIEIRVTAKDSKGAYSLIEMTLPPRFPGAPPHYHEKMSERFVVVDGSLELRIGDELLTLASGDSRVANAQQIHTFRNATDSAVTLLIIARPGGHEEFFRELMAWMAAEPVWPPADRHRLVQFGKRHDSHYV